MRGIGGNTQGVIQVKTTLRGEDGRALRDETGSTMTAWEDAQTIKGWLDLSGGEAKYRTYDAKIQESTHVFIADYVPLDARIGAESARMRIGGKAYDIMLMDNPMDMGGGSQWEIYLKYTGGQ